jgi:N-acetylglucosaminyl-diphospho-decaprenol L-rhamnosyltransferase
MGRAERPLVDVCVVTWNTAELTATAIRRLIDSDQGCRLRVLVRDNGSSDGTADALAERVPEAVVDAGTENLGFAAGVNTILARSDAPWVFLLNSDAWPEPGAIGRLVASAERHPRAAAVAPRLERPNGTLEHSTFPFPSVGLAATMAFRRGALTHERADALMLEDDWMHDRERAVDWAVGAALLIRRAALESIGGFDERFFMYVEDVEWCWRARKKGWEVWFDPSAVVRHVGNASGEKRFGEARTREHLMNLYEFFRREHGGPATALYRGLNLAGCGLRYLGARRRRDADLAHYWRSQLRANSARRRPGGRRR